MRSSRLTFLWPALALLVAMLVACAGDGPTAGSSPPAGLEISGPAVLLFYTDN